MGNFFSSIKSFYSEPDLFPNWDFEVWDSIYIERPEEWGWQGIVEKVTSFDGGTAVKLTTDTSRSRGNPGVVLLGNPEGDDTSLVFWGGVPFSERPDSVSAYFNFEINTDDSAMVIYAFKKNGSPVAFDWFFIKGSSGGNFVPLSFPINYTSPDIPDTVVLGFLNTNPFLDTAKQGSFLMVDKVSFPGASQTVPNADFEDWINFGFENARFWTVTHFEGLKRFPLQMPYFKTTESFSGNYAFEIQNDTLNPDNGQGIGLVLMNDEESSFIPSFPIYHRPSSLNGYYKYFPENGDSCRITIALFKNGLQIGFGYFFTDSAFTQFTPFSIPIQYNDSANPDSAFLQINSTSTFKLFGNTKLVLDALSFDNLMFADNSTVSVFDDLQNRPDGVVIKLYPNPAHNYLYFDIQNAMEDSRLMIFDISGKVILKSAVKSIPPPGSENILLNTGEIINGMYFFNYSDEKNNVSGKFIIQH